MTGELDDLSDADLIVLAREGDRLAYGVLWKRHWEAGRGMAASITSRFDPDDLASEAFARILISLGRGKGPTAGFRSYLATTVRNVAIDWSRRKASPNIEDADVIEDWTYSEITALDRIDRQTMAEAFYALPDKWQEVLWYTEVEDMAPREVAPIMGLNANAVSALALRAREGLRQSWINAHLAAAAPTEDPVHNWTIKKLGSFVRGRLARADRRKIIEHLDACSRCADAASEADRVGSRLALGILPLFLGLAGATAYLAGTGSGGSAVAATLPDASIPHASIPDSTAVLRHGGHVRHVSAVASVSPKAGMAAVAASVVAAAALTYGVVIATPQTDVTSAETSEKPSTESPEGQRVSPDRPERPRPPGQEQKGQLQPAPPAVRAPETGGEDTPTDPPSTDAVEPPAAAGGGGGTDDTREPVAPPSGTPSPSPIGCEAAIRAIPSEHTLFAYRLDDPAGTSTATDLVHGGTAQYSGEPEAGEWSLADDALRPPTDRFTIQIWFKARQGGGRLLGFSGSAGSLSAYYDRHLFLTDDGRLVFGVFPDEIHTIASTDSYIDDRWHQATATLSEDGMALYVDGARVAQDTTVTQGHQFDGFWRIGADNLDNWGPETPSSRQVAGTLAFAAVYSVALSADEVLAQWKLCV